MTENKRNETSDGASNVIDRSYWTHAINHIDLQFSGDSDLRMPCIFASGWPNCFPNSLSAPTNPLITPWSYPRRRKAWQLAAVSIQVNLSQLPEEGKEWRYLLQPNEGFFLEFDPYWSRSREKQWTRCGETWRRREFRGPHDSQLSILKETAIPQHLAGILSEISCFLRCELTRPASCHELQCLKVV